MQRHGAVLLPAIVGQLVIDAFPEVNALEFFHRHRLRVGGAATQVWFDQSELRGGDSWDQSIRKQIKECALFAPIVSANTQARRDGYFRLEWKLADDRTHLMARGTPFLLPVCVDDTKDWDAIVPDSFMTVQWTRLPSGEMPAKFCDRVQTLLKGGDTPARPRPAPAPTSSLAAAPEKKFPRWAFALGAVALIGVGLFFVSRSRQPAVPPPVPAPVTPAAAAWPRDPELKHAMDLVNGTEANSEDFALAEEIKSASDVAAVQIAWAYAFRHENDRAFEWLERAYHQHDGGLAWTKANFALESLHPDPRWPAFWKKIGMPDEQLK